MFFGGAKKMTLKEQTRKWQRELKQESRKLDRQIRASNLQEKKIQREIQKYAKKGERKALTILAKDMVRGRRTRDRLHTAKAQLNSVSMQLQEQMCMAKVAGALQQSTGVMQAMSKVVRLPAVAEACQQMAREMSKAGIIQEMQDDMFEMLEPDDMEDEIEDEVNKVVLDILGPMPEVGEKSLPGAEAAGISKEDAAPAVTEDDVGVSDMEARLAALA